MEAQVEIFRIATEVDGLFKFENPIVQLLSRVTEPVLKPLRRLLPPSATGGIDVSPILAILLIHFVRYIFIYSFSPAPRLF